MPRETGCQCQIEVNLSSPPPLSFLPKNLWRLFQFWIFFSAVVSNFSGDQLNSDALLLVHNSAKYDSNLSVTFDLKVVSGWSFHEVYTCEFLGSDQVPVWLASEAPPAKDVLH